MYINVIDISLSFYICLYVSEEIALKYIHTRFKLLDVIIFQQRYYRSYLLDRFILRVIILSIDHED